MVGMLDDWSGSPYADMGGPDPAILALLQRQFGGGSSFAGRPPGTTPGGAMGATDAPAPGVGMLSGMMPSMSYRPYASPVDEGGFTGAAERVLGQPPVTPIGSPAETYNWPAEGGGGAPYADMGATGQPPSLTLPGGFDPVPMGGNGFGSLSPPAPPVPAPVPTSTPLTTAGRPVGEGDALPAPAAAIARVASAAADPNNKSVPETSLLGRIAQAMNDNSGTLLGLASGLAGAPSWGVGLGRGFAAAGAGATRDQTRKEARLTETTTYEALRRRGLSEETARLASRQPEVLKSILPRLFGGQKGVVVNDRLVDPTTGRVIADFSDLNRKAPQTVDIEVNGEKKAMQWDYKAQRWTPVDGAGGSGEPPTNPYSLGNKTTEAQSKDATYAERMHSAERIFREPGVVEAALSVPQRTMGAIPGAGNFMVSKEYQKFDQAQRNFINATLRRESGAVISDDEFANAKLQYFPQPGDGTEKLAQKQQNRIDAIKGISSGASSRYRVPYLFGPKGEIIEHKSPNTAPKPGNYIYDPAQRKLIQQ
jgi:hypothetical protein